MVNLRKVAGLRAWGLLHSETGAWIRLLPCPKVRSGSSQKPHMVGEPWTFCRNKESQTAENPEQPNGLSSGFDTSLTLCPQESLLSGVLAS
jgi:hypothetical protein